MKREPVSDRETLNREDRPNFWARYLKVETWINRPLASVLVRLTFHTSVTPNQLTVAAFLFALAAAAGFSRGTVTGAVVGAVLCEVSLVFDCAEGMLARARKACSRFGSFMDLFFGRISDFCVLLGITVGNYRASGENQGQLILGLLVISLYMLQVILYYIFNRFLDAASGESGEGRALAILLVFILGLMNRLDLIIYAMLVETVINLCFRITRFFLAGWRSNRRGMPM